MKDHLSHTMEADGDVIVTRPSAAEPSRSLSRTRTRARGYALKDPADRVLALLLLVLFAPLLLAIACCIRASGPGGVLFAQRRIGQDGRMFHCLKFRTMVQDAGTALERHLARNPAARREWEATRKLKDDPRITPIGQVLRKSSLDELPQLINVLRGEMSLVGPRPIVQEEARYYGAAIHDYVSVRPGITGLWQVSGRNDVGYGERVALDRHYAQSLSMLGDLRILLRTAVVVVQRRGSY